MSEAFKNPTLDPAAAAAASSASAALDEGRERTHWEELARLVPYARNHRVLLTVTLILSLLLAVIDVPVPFMLKHIIDANSSACVFANKSHRRRNFGILDRQQIG